jgi:hypothetical protein
MDEGDCGAIGGTKIDRGSRSTRRKPTPAPLCPPQIPHDQAWARTRATAVGSQRLTAWTMARPSSCIVSNTIWFSLRTSWIMVPTRRGNSLPRSGGSWMPKRKFSKEVNWWRFRRSHTNCLHSPPWIHTFKCTTLLFRRSLDEISASGRSEQRHSHRFSKRHNFHACRKRWCSHSGNDVSTMPYKIIHYFIPKYTLI